MSWLPRIFFFNECIAEDEFEAEGRKLQIVWGLWIFEIGVARIDRLFDEIDWENAQ